MPSFCDEGFSFAGKGIRMLEFQESFFEQEIREGFYIIDKSMKASWAEGGRDLRQI